MDGKIDTQRKEKDILIESDGERKWRRGQNRIGISWRRTYRKHNRDKKKRRELKTLSITRYKETNDFEKCPKYINAENLEELIKGRR